MEKLENELITAVSLDHQRISADQLKQRIANFQNLVAGLPANTVAQEVKEEALHITGLTYFFEVDGVSNRSAVASKIVWTREPSQDFVARDLEVISFFWFIIGVRPGGVGMDVKRNIVNPVSTSGKAEDERGWMLVAGSFGSAAENGVFEQLYGINSVSTEKLLSLANQQGIPIYTINKDNINQILPNLPLAGIVKQNIRKVKPLIEIISWEHLNSRCSHSGFFNYLGRSSTRLIRGIYHDYCFN